MRRDEFPLIDKIIAENDSKWLKVIEDVKAEVETNIASLDGYIELSDFGKGVRGGLSKALEIIDRKVNSLKTLSSNGEYLESIDRKVNEVKDDEVTK